MLLSDERAELEFHNKSTAYAAGILFGGLFATVVSIPLWVATILYILYNNGYWL